MRSSDDVEIETWADISGTFGSGEFSTTETLPSSGNYYVEARFKNNTNINGASPTFTVPLTFAIQTAEFGPGWNLPGALTYNGSYMFTDVMKNALARVNNHNIPEYGVDADLARCLGYEATDVKFHIKNYPGTLGYSGAGTGVNGYILGSVGSPQTLTTRSEWDNLGS